MKTHTPLLLALALISWSPLNANPWDQTLEEFRFLSSMDRRSGHEAIVRAAIERRVAGLQGLWGNRLQIQSDAAGNLLITVPATGKFATISSEPVALQAHLDMVPAVAGLDAEVDLSPYFRSGVALEIVDGWLQSHQRKTSIGADNGIGVAMALRYVSHPQIEHPELEIVLTVEEETTFKGALEISLPLRSRNMINLDGEEENEIWSGCMGYTDKKVTLPFRTQWSANPSFVEVKLSDLAGGHSGLNASRDRLDAVEYSLHLASMALNDSHRAQIIRYRAGDAESCGSIASSMTILFASPSLHAARELERAVRANYRDYIAGRFADEKSLRTKLAINRWPGEPMHSVPSRTWKKLIEFIGSQSRGVVEKDGRFANGVKTTYRIPYIFSESNSADGVIKFGYGGRSYDNDLLAQNQIKFTRAATQLAQSLNSDLEQTTSMGPGWVNTEGALTNIFRQLMLGSSLVTVAGTLESGAILKRYPQMEIVSVGPQIEDIHTPLERVNLQSLGRKTILLDQALVEAGNLVLSKGPNPLQAECSSR